METKVICFTNRDTNEQCWTDECQTPEEFQERFSNCTVNYVFDALKH